jgi:tetratricopeptide (TPR) repeat protein
MMMDPEKATMPYWETKTLEAATPEALFSFLFYTLLEDGHFSIDARTFYATQRLPTLRDQALVEALTTFVAEIPTPTTNDSRDQFLRCAESGRRLDQLAPGASDRLVRLITKTPALSYSKWPEWLIVASEEKMGWTCVSKEPMIEDGIVIGTTYSFRRPAGTQAKLGEGIIADATTGKWVSTDTEGVEVAMLYNKANALAREGRFEEAIQNYEAAVDIDPCDASVYNNMATAYKLIGRLREAESAYRKALQVDPMYYRAHFRLACILVSQGREWEAQEEILRYFQSGATMAEAETLLTGLEEADDVRRLIARIQPEVPAAPEGAGMGLGQRRPAELKFEEAMRLRQSNREAAAQALQAAIRLDPGFGLAYRELGGILFEMGAYEEALQKSELATQLLPNDAEAWTLYGDRCVNRFHVDRALEAYERAVELNPNHSGANRGLGGVLTNMIEVGRALERVAEAERHLQRAISLEPSHDLSHFLLGRLYKATGNLEKARQTYERWLELCPDNPIPLRELRSLGPERGRGSMGGFFRRRR